MIWPLGRIKIKTGKYDGEDPALPVFLHWPVATNQLKDTSKAVIMCDYLNFIFNFKLLSTTKYKKALDRRGNSSIQGKNKKE
jgi:hypothetical protein